MEREANVEVLDFDKSQNIEVLVQEEVQLDINVPLFYIKSGEEDIKAYVTNHAKPELDAHTTSAVDKINQAEASSIADMEIAKDKQVAAVNQAGQIAAENVAGDAIEIVDNHANSVIIPQLQEFTAEAQTQATNAATSASSALASKTSAESYATQAKNYATSASTSETNAQKYAIRAENSLLPNQTGNGGKVLMTDGTSPYWGEYKSSNHQIVSVLPAEPDTDTFYYIPE